MIDAYSQELQDILDDPQSSEKAVLTINRLKKLASWKFNLFALYMYFGKTGILAEKLGVKSTALSVTIHNIKQEIKSAQ